MTKSANKGCVSQGFWESVTCFVALKTDKVLLLFPGKQEEWKENPDADDVFQGE